jgi:hypothetical protein
VYGLAIFRAIRADVRNMLLSSVRVHREERHMAIRATRNLGMLLLAIWLILYGISGLVGLGVPAPLMAVLALLAGILILAGR